jgi:hypothetical protein
VTRAVTRPGPDSEQRGWAVTGRDQTRLGIAREGRAANSAGRACAEEGGGTGDGRGDPVPRASLAQRRHDVVRRQPLLEPLAARAEPLRLDELEVARRGVLGEIAAAASGASCSDSGPRVSRACRCGIRETGPRAMGEIAHTMPLVCRGGSEKRVSSRKEEGYLKERSWARMGCWPMAAAWAGIVCTCAAHTSPRVARAVCRGCDGAMQLMSCSCTLAC